MDDLEKEEQAINAKAEENSSTEAPTVEETTSEVEDEAVPSEKTEKSTEQSDTKDEKKLSGAEKRIHEVIDQRDKYKSEVEDLSSRLAELTAGTQEDAEIPQYYNQYPETSGERELTLDDLRTIARLEVEKERTVARINQEAQEVQKIYTQLDKTSKDFDPEVNEAVTTAVWLEIQRDPSKSVKSLTDKYMKPYLKAAERAVGNEKENLAKQVSESALRPSNVKGNEKTFQDKTPEEMEQELGMVY